jgi:hypothetical protein
MEFARRLDEERQKKQEEDELHALEEEAKKEARGQKIQEFISRAKQHLAEHALEQALAELMKIYVIDPDHREARQIEQSVRNEQKEKWNRELSGKQKVSREGFMESYRQALVDAWSTGALTKDERTLLDNLRFSLGITEAEHLRLEKEAKADVYASALRYSRKNEGAAADGDADQLALMREELGITEEQHRAIEERMKEG